MLHPRGHQGEGVSYWGSIGVEDTHHPPSNRETLTLKNVFSALFIIYVHRVSQIHICSKGVQILNSSYMFQGCPNFKFIIYVHRVSQFHLCSKGVQILNSSYMSTGCPNFIYVPRVSKL